MSVVRGLVTLVFMSLMLSHCGEVGEKSDGAGSGSAKYEEVTGNLISQTNSVSEFEDWQLVLVNQENGESRVASVDGSGNFTITDALQDGVFSLALTNAELKLTAVLSMISEDQTNKVHQFFKLKSETIPQLIFKGSTVEFSSTEEVTIQDDVANDEDGDGIPDGMETTSLLLAEADSDNDGNANSEDADIDGDGLLNWFDSDDDNNDTLDVFDLDANADQVTDAAQTIGDHYFGEQVEYLAVQVFSQPSSSSTKIRLTLKVDTSSLQPDTVSILSSSSLFDESLNVNLNAEGDEETNDIWDLTLVDDGANFDGSAEDGIYARKIKLKAGKEIQEKQLVFFQVTVGDKIRYFPFMFTNVSTGTIGFSYDSSTFTKSGDPFSGVSDYNWIVKVFDSDGALVHSSPAIEAATETYTLPDGTLDSDQSYTAKVYAQSLERVKNYPAYIVESEESSL